MVARRRLFKKAKDVSQVGSDGKSKNHVSFSEDGVYEYFLHTCGTIMVRAKTTVPICGVTQQREPPKGGEHALNNDYCLLITGIVQIREMCQRLTGRDAAVNAIPCYRQAKDKQDAMLISAPSRVSTPSNQPTLPIHKIIAGFTVGAWILWMASKQFSKANVVRSLTQEGVTQLPKMSTISSGMWKGRKLAKGGDTKTFGTPAAPDAELADRFMGYLVDVAEPVAPSRPRLKKTNKKIVRRRLKSAKGTS